ncbi:hypothetical protein DL766_003036 [Monosporascus sp. MC13-8B]|uniref:FAD-binding domain-containing protein n=1 Tax=Monosporascus cannonballus TaxID=155416 RepID=A0ABY0HB93_9PEZI|nr:hypothetical protein DL762_004711 [Monosporascus cannonballus]RYO98762.1 hypothetical protein DL763_002023 [Monosporascus cannonballus]RYP34387.1 hypothetical protein DL766_003036 [Monosporascus sp. MC13-8B]
MESQPPGQPSPVYYDIVIVGAGPVGLMLSTCLARWGYKVKHIDNRAEPTPTGRADGIQPRSLDLLRNMGLKSAIMAHNPARVFEVAFWDPPKEGKGIVRTGTWASCPSFIDARYPFTTLLHQGLIERVFITDLEKHGVKLQRPWSIKGFKSDDKENPDYPVEVDIEHVDGAARETVRAKYLFSGEGARSFVRDKLGIEITHKDPISHVWGVMDGVVETDFPDIKPKAGQGMNTAFLDAQNLAWKIHAVEAGFADRTLLTTYEPERRAVAESLLDFDNRYAKLFSQRPPAAREVQAASNHTTGSATEENEFIKTFKESCEFTSGYGVAYGPNFLNWSPSHPAQSPLVLTYPEDTRLQPGHLMINADVTRVVDANFVHLDQQIPLNGSFRIYVFAGRPSPTTQKALGDLASHAGKGRSFLTSYLRPDLGDVGHRETLNPHSLFFTLCTVFAAPRASIEIGRDVPPLLARYRDLVFADDRFDRRVPDAKAAAHAKMGLDPERGGVVVVRPDGYVGIVVRLVEGSGTVDVLNEYFSSFCTRKLRGGHRALL